MTGASRRASRRRGRVAMWTKDASARSASTVRTGGDFGHSERSVGCTVVAPHRRGANQLRLALGRELLTQRSVLVDRSGSTKGRSTLPAAPCLFEGGGGGLRISAGAGHH